MTGGDGTMHPEARPPLVGEERAEQLRQRWADVQNEFVEDPRHAVVEADQLVEDVIEAIRDRFENQRTALDRRWNAGEELTTEELRHVLQDYRDLFATLLDVR